MPISENELIVPALLAMLNSPNFTIQTSDLIRVIESQTELDDQDMTTLQNRKDEKFTQIVRNLKSHKRFKKSRLAEEIEGGFRLTAEGAEWLEENGHTN